MSTLRTCYAEAVNEFLESVGWVAPGRWDAPALDDWSMRDLVGHTSRALSTVEAYLATPAAGGVTITRPVDYFIGALFTPGAPFADPAALTARAREAGAALGPDPPAAVRALAARVLAVVEAAPDEAILGTPVGGIRLIDYFPSRIVELTVHTADIAAATGREFAPGQGPFEVTLQVLGGMALHHGAGATVLRALCGRESLPGGFSVL